MLFVTFATDLFGGIFSGLVGEGRFFFGFFGFRFLGAEVSLAVVGGEIDGSRSCGAGGDLSDAAGGEECSSGVAEAERHYGRSGLREQMIGFPLFRLPTVCGGRLLRAREEDRTVDYCPSVSWMMIDDDIPYLLYIPWLWSVVNKIFRKQYMLIKSSRQYHIQTTHKQTEHVDSWNSVGVIISLVL